MTHDPVRVLVTGADQHQGLAVMRGLGRAGMQVIATGADARSLGFYSRYATDTATYRSPITDPAGFAMDMLTTIDRTKPDLIVPAVESTLTGLVAIRDEVERRAPLAAPPPKVLRASLDKATALRQAVEHGVRVPRTVQAGSVDALTDLATALHPPYVLKPRGHGGDLRLPTALDFKVQYAPHLGALRRLLLPLAAHVSKLVVQEYVPGIGRCVAGVWRQGRPVVLFAYEREREYPVTGGVGVVRRSIRIDDTIEAMTVGLLEAIGWHGVAMVEYKYDRRTGTYTFMEINGRFQASTALAVDAGINLPAVTVAVHLGRPMVLSTGYRIGMVERWLRGDIRALGSAFVRPASGPPVNVPIEQVAWNFVRDFARASRYDEFAADDWLPAVVEALSLMRESVGFCVSAIASAVRWVRRRATTAPVEVRAATTQATSAPTQRSMRA